MGRYVDPVGSPREVIALPGRAGSVLVVDRDAGTLRDRRLVAHLGADEPPANARLVCRHYLSDPAARWCRRVSACDLAAEPFPSESPAASDVRAPGAQPLEVELVDADGWRHSLQQRRGRSASLELRWCRRPPPGTPGERVPESVREAIGCLESYEPVRSLTAAAVARHGERGALSVAELRTELRRLDASSVVLNRGLRLAVVRAVRTQGLTLSEIALRCGRVKRDGRGRASGETTWLARRVGLAPGAGESAPTPWVHSDVLALIARRGLGIGPREVELG